MLDFLVPVTLPLAMSAEAKEKQTRDSAVRSKYLTELDGRYSLTKSEPWGTLFEETAQQALSPPAPRAVAVRPTMSAHGEQRR